ncbi:unnamed protein product [Trypanosoma congolense IL3000]|uniref:WGS project CAEQ00000000 data, annotated contig 2453 n=1 Tax=Trypanosoma congolense (strain IL3000) TaxID=1068625 RepID=F9WEB3_TRYCI|nr:unnamed protein product [Trypanosoma congolense IL3000]
MLNGLFLWREPRRDTLVGSPFPWDLIYFNCDNSPAVCLCFTWRFFLTKFAKDVRVLAPHFAYVENHLDTLYSLPRARIDSVFLLSLFFRAALVDTASFRMWRLPVTCSLNRVATIQYGGLAIISDHTLPHHPSSRGVSLYLPIDMFSNLKYGTFWLKEHLYPFEEASLG